MQNSVQRTTTVFSSAFGAALNLILMSLLLLLVVGKTAAQQAYCWDRCVDTPCFRIPRLCPTETMLTYYDCCPLEGCCQFVKWPNLMFVIIICILLIGGCCCCAFFLLTDARQRMYQKEEERNRSRGSSAAAAPIPYPQQIYTVNGGGRQSNTAQQHDPYFNIAGRKKQHQTIV